MHHHHCQHCQHYQSHSPSVLDIFFSFFFLIVYFIYVSSLPTFSIPILLLLVIIIIITVFEIDMMSPHCQPLVLFWFWLNWISLCPIASHAKSHVVYKHDEVDMPQKYIQVEEELSRLPFWCFSGSPLLPT